MPCPVIVSSAHVCFTAACMAHVGRAGVWSRADLPAATSRNLFADSTGSPHHWQLSSSRWRIPLLQNSNSCFEFYHGRQNRVFCFPSFLFKETLSSIKALTATVCLPFAPSVNAMCLSRVASSACNSSDCAVVLGQQNAPACRGLSVNSALITVLNGVCRTEMEPNEPSHASPRSF